MAAQRTTPIRVTVGAAYDTAVRDEQRSDVRDRLLTWPSVRDALRPS